MGINDPARLLPHDHKRRGVLINMLHWVTVYEAEQITIEWSIPRSAGKTLPGRADSGRVKLHAAEKKLEIYMSREQITSQSCPIELVEYLADFCGIQGSESIMILQHILIETNLENIADALDRRGILDIKESPDPIPGRSCPSSLPAGFKLGREC